MISERRVQNAKKRQEVAYNNGLPLEWRAQELEQCTRWRGYRGGEVVGLVDVSYWTIWEG